MSYITNVITTLKSFYPEMFRMTWSKILPSKTFFEAPQTVAKIISIQMIHLVLKKNPHVKNCR